MTFDLLQHCHAVSGTGYATAAIEHIVADEPFPWDLAEGAKGVQLAEKGIESWEKKCWVNVPKIDIL